MARLRVDLDAVDAHVHRDLHRALHGALEGDAALELLGDSLGDELRVGIGSLHLLDLDVDFLLGHLLELGADRLDVTALVADDHAGTRAEQRHADAVGVALDEDLGDPRLGEFLLADFADLLILDEERAERLLGREPAAAPGVRDAYAEAYGVDFLSHVTSLPSWPSSPRRG